MKILVACEESQAVTKELRALGHDAFSCDIIDCSGGYPEWHIKDDALKVAYDKSYQWDMMIAHPPCTYLSVSGLHWNKKRPERALKTEESLKFVQELMNAPIDKIAIENPVSCISTRIRKPNQIVHPYYFGEKASKATCLWLKNLPILVSTNVVEKGEFMEYKDRKTGKTKRMAKWCNDIALKSMAEKNPEKRKVLRQRLRSVTFTGIAKAMAEQWTSSSHNQIKSPDTA